MPWILARATLLVGLVCASVADGLAQPARVSDGVVRIGVLGDMTSLYSDLGGQGSVIAAQMAVDDFGRSVLGAPVEVIAADHQNNAQTGANRAQDWLEAQQVDMITDLTNSGVALAVSKLATAKKKLVIVVGAASTRLTNEDCTPYTIHYAYDTYALANGTARTIVRQGGDSWFFVTVDYAFGLSLEKDTSEAVAASGGKVLGRVRHPLNVGDALPYLLQAKASRSKVIGLANAGGDSINSIRAAAELGLTSEHVVAGLLVFLTDVHSLGLQIANGMIFTDGYYWDFDDETRRFAKRFFAKARKMPTMVHAGVYSATTNYLKAVREAGTDDAAAVVAQLRKMDLSDFFARNAQLREDGRVVKDMYLVQVKKPAESKYPWDYYQIKATIPAGEAFQPLARSRCPLVKK
jgi:branched-chain amino acid transport system substrate-binding protein